MPEQRWEGEARPAGAAENGSHPVAAEAPEAGHPGDQPSGTAPSQTASSDTGLPHGEPRRAASLPAMLAAVVPPVTLLTALGVWYGYELALARGRYFGLDTTVIDFSTQEYVLRAVVAVLGPMLVLLVVAASLAWWHVAVLGVLGRSDRERWRSALRLVGAALVASGLVALLAGLRAVGSAGVLPDHQVLRTLLVGAGVLGLSYGGWMIRQLPAAPGPGGASRDAHEGPAAGPADLWHRTGYLITIGAVLVCVFWAFSVAAEERGAADAARLHQEGFARLPGVVVFAKEPLALDGQGVETTEVAVPGSAYPWRYDGLRLLVRSDQRYFLVPVGWQPGGSTVLVLDEGPDVRFEFASPEGTR